MGMGSRSAIGLQAIQLNSEYAADIYRGAIDACEEADADLVIFPGRVLDAPYAFDYQHNILYDYVNPATVDAFVIISSSLFNFSDEAAFGSLLERLAPLPLVSIGMELPGESAILLDNDRGMRELMAHLLDDHGYRRFALIEGPANNPDAMVRKAIFREELAARGIDPLSAAYLPGDFAPVLHDDTARFLRGGAQGAECVVAANDEMALAALAILSEEGVAVPDKVAVTGFDSIERTRFSSPTLTTVSQPLYEEGRAAIALALERLGGGPPRNLQFGSALVRRCSCGCLSRSLRALGPGPKALGRDGRESHREAVGASPLAGARGLDDFLREFDSAVGGGPEEGCLRAFSGLSRGLEAGRSGGLDELLDSLSRGLDAEAEAARAARAGFLLQKLRVLAGEAAVQSQATRRVRAEELMRSMREVMQRMISIVYVEDLMDSIRTDLPRLGVRSCYLAAYEGDVHWRRGGEKPSPDRSRLLLGYGEWGEERLSLPGGASFPSRLLVPRGLLPRDRRTTMVAYPLYFREHQLGVMLFEMLKNDGDFYETLCSQISSALKTSMLFDARKRAEERLHRTLEELERSNEKLENLSQTDDLTGLYNRRGFISFAEQALKLAARMNKSGVLIFADLDGLKTINDQHGHEEGDEAIRKAAALLRSNFRTSDIVARLGGDEFVVLAVESSFDFIEQLRKRLDAQMAAHNASSGKPYALSMSMGAAPLEELRNADLEELLRRADQYLYEEKRAKKAARGAGEGKHRPIGSPPPAADQGTKSRLRPPRQ